MQPVYAIATHLMSSLGVDVAAHWKAAANRTTGIKQHEDLSLSSTTFFAAKMDAAQWQRIHECTKTNITLSPFEQMAIYSAKQAIANCTEDIDLSQTAFILSSTKGNIEWLNQVPDERILLATSAGIIAKELGIKTQPIVIAHACVSGVVASIYGMRLLQSGRYKQVIITGADRFTKFVLSGFQSFQAVAAAPCRPFDANRTGINLGEAAATIILSANKQAGALASMLAGSTSNDANHISGPSRTGEELALAITKTLQEASLTPKQIDMISAHGTATLYNDEMESKAFGIADVAHAPTHSFKGYIGHTLGAAGIAESAMVIESLRQQQIIPSLGFDNLGVSQALNITQEMKPVAINYVLKTASGFGGCNAASLWGQ